MGVIWRVAWRNLGRNTKRTLITGGGLALGVGMCIATLGITDGLNKDLSGSITDLELGHVQIQHQKYIDTQNTGFTIQDSEALKDKISDILDVEGVSQRLYAWGYMSHGDKSTGVQLMGLFPEDEMKVTKLNTYLEKGEYAIDSPSPWRKSQQLSKSQKILDQKLTEWNIELALAEIGALESNRDISVIKSEIDSLTRELVDQLAPRPGKILKVVLGYKLAKKLNSNIDSHLSILLETNEGSQSSFELEVVGIIKTGTDSIDQARVLVNLEDLRNMVLKSGQAHEISVRIKDVSQASAWAHSINEKWVAAGNKIHARSWSEVRPDILALVVANKALMGTLVFIVFMVTGIGVLNTMLMSVFERKRELSVLKALGMKPSWILSMIAIETMILTFFSAGIGIVVGLMLNFYFIVFGIDVSEFGEFEVSGVGMNSILRADITVEGVIFPVIIMFVVAMLAALYPAFKAVRIEAAEGMRGR